MRFIIERLKRRSAGCLQRRKNAAAFCQDVQIAHTIELFGKFMLTATAIDQMRVRIDETRCCHHAATIFHFRIGIYQGLRNIAFTDGQNLVTVKCNIGIL